MTDVERCPCNETPTPGVTIAGDVCSLCLGATWRWKDGRPPTTCLAPSNIQGLPCGRSGDTCPGCKRSAADIGTIDDVVATLKARKGLVAAQVTAVACPVCAAQPGWGCKGQRGEARHPHLERRKAAEARR